MASSTGQTLSADGFLSGLGVDTHIAYTDGEYSQVSLIVSDLQYLGVDQVRDGISDGANGSAPLSSYIALAKAGIHFTFLIEATSTSSLNATIDLINQVEAAAPGSITAIEGPNEINNQPLTFNGVSGLQGALDLQGAIYSTVHGDLTLKGVAVDYFTGYGNAGIAVGPDPVSSGLADFDTQHPYPKYGEPPAASVARSATLPNTSNANEPAVYTETGYSSFQVDTTVQAKYTLDLLMDTAQQGISKTFLYQLMDAYAPGSVQGDDGTGLFDDAEAPKPVATAIHNLTTLLHDSGANAATFQSTPLNYTVSGLPSSGDSLALEESNGSYFIVVWAEPEIWNNTTKTEIAAPSESVTVSLPNSYGSVQVFDPLTGVNAISSVTNKSSVTVTVTDHPILIEISNPASITSTTGIGADGYIVGATVFADANTSGVYAAGDAETTTGNQGQFTLTGAEGPLILEGGTDSDTHLAFQGTLEAPSGSTVITPLTTLVDALLPTAPTGSEITTAESDVLSAFGLTLGSGQTLTSLDPVGGTLADNADAQATFNAGAEVLDTVDVLSAALSSFTGKSASLSFRAVITGFADEIAAHPGAVLDLTNAATVQAILTSAATALGVSTTITSSFAATLTTIITASNAALTDSDASLTGGAAIKAVSAVEYVAQSETASALEGGASPTTVAADYTGAKLTSDIAQADGNVACYAQGTMILTPEGERPVEAVNIGDLVVTGSGQARPIKWIGRRSYRGSAAASRSDILPVCFKTGSLADRVPHRDLWVSPQHAMLLEGALIPAILLANGTSIFQAKKASEVHYIHLELESHDVILAEGAHSETFVDDFSRGVFHNAPEYVALYPGDQAQGANPQFCAPRIEDGFELEAIREALIGRSKRLGEDGTAAPVETRGFLEVAKSNLIEGWAFDAKDPDRAVDVLVICDHSIIARVTAGSFRQDLLAAGIGDGRHAFSLSLVAELSSEVAHEIELRAADDFKLLQGSPIILPPRGFQGGAVGQLKGRIDVATHALVSGWAQDDLQPHRPVGLVISVNDQVLTRVLANRYRADLASLSGSEGRLAFEWPIPQGLARSQTQVIRVQREADGAELPGSPWTLPALKGFGHALDDLLEEVLGRSSLEEDEDRALGLLSRHTEALLQRRAERKGDGAAQEALRAYQRRWGGASGLTDEPVRVSGDARRALVIDDRLPVAGRDAGSVALLTHMRGLKALGYQVCFAPSVEASEASALRQFSLDEDLTTCAKPHYTCIEDILLRHAGAFELIYLHRISNAQRYMALARAYCPKAQIIYSVADLHHLRLAGQARVEGRPEILALARQAERTEIEASVCADVVLTHSFSEAQTLRRRNGLSNVHVAPFAPSPRRAAPPVSQRHGIGFVGSFAHAPNPDAVWWLAQEVLPRIWAKNPELHCKIVGHGWKPNSLRGLDPRIEILGPLADLDELFSSVRLTVAPLRFGSGVKGKVLESFAAAVPCVMSPVAAEGLELPPLLRGLVSASPAELAERILQVHSDEDINVLIGDQSRAWVTQNFSQDQVTESLRSALSLPTVKALQQVG